MTALFLSPHLDDVAFSCGGTVAALSAAGWRCVLATAFTASVPNPTGFALECQTSKGVQPNADYLAIRRAEDAAACRHLGAEPAWLGLPEAPHRGYQSAPALFAGVRPGDDIAASLVPLLLGLRDELTPEAVFAPQGLGNHADHLQLVRAVLGVWPAAAVTWYRDTPYAVRDPAARPAPGVPGGQAWARAVGDTLAPKLDACAAYATQLGFQFGGPERMRAVLSAFAEVEGQGTPAERFTGRRSA